MSYLVIIMKAKLVRRQDTKLSRASTGLSLHSARLLDYIANFPLLAHSHDLTQDLSEDSQRVLGLSRRPRRSTRGVSRAKTATT